MSYYLAKPFRFHYLQPDILNFPNQNQELARDFNFACELFKFLSKPVTVAFDGQRLTGPDDEGSHELGGWTVTEEWYNALNEYSIPDHLKDEIYSKEWNPSHGDQNYRPENNTDVINYYENVLNKGPWGWHPDWVFGFNHFTQGLYNEDMEYFWGEKVASGYNVDFIAEGWEWNHLEEKKGLGLAGLFEDINASGPKDATLDADVDQAYFVGDFLEDLGMAWSDINNVLNRFKDYSYYEIVMNAVDPSKVQHSYKSLNPEDLTLLVTAFLESRNRVYSIAEKVFGPVVYTWDDARPTFQAGLILTIRLRFRTVSTLSGCFCTSSINLSTPYPCFLKLSRVQWVIRGGC